MSISWRRLECHQADLGFVLGPAFDAGYQRIIETADGRSG